MRKRKRKRKRTRGDGWTRGWEWIKGDGGGMSGWTSNVGSHNELRQNPCGERCRIEKEGETVDNNTIAIKGSMLHASR